MTILKVIVFFQKSRKAQELVRGIRAKALLNFGVVCCVDKREVGELFSQGGALFHFCGGILKHFCVNTAGAHLGNCQKHQICQRQVSLGTLAVLLKQGGECCEGVPHQKGGYRTADRFCRQPAVFGKDHFGKSRKINDLKKESCIFGETFG